MLSTYYSVAVNSNSHSTSLGVLFAGHSQTEPLHDVGPQVLDYYLLHYIVSGQGTFHCRGKSYTLRQGDSFLIFPGELVQYISDAQSPWKYRWIAFNGTQSKELLERLKISPESPCPTSNHARRSNALFHQTQLILRKGGSNADLRSLGYLHLILSEYNEQETPALGMQRKTEAQLQADKAIHYLKLQYSRQVSISELAQSLGYHRTHFSKIFKEQTGWSPTDYLLKIRMERAAYLLINEDLTIQHIASSVGFADSLYFSRQFRKWHGVSPTDYRIQNKTSQNREVSK